MDVLPNTIYAREAFLPMSLPREDLQRTKCHSADTPLFDVPDKFVKIMDRDLVAAGIARRIKVDGKWRIEKRDERGRTIDVHALRHSFGTLLSKGGVSPRTAQAAMRHSTIDLTMNTYTDPKLLDVQGALKRCRRCPWTPPSNQSAIQ